MKIPLYQIDAFSGAVFGGNPAAVCPLDEWLPDPTMQAIALENNLSETAFFVRSGDTFAIRWFTPADEVALCGHATLASGHALFNILDPGRTSVTFSSKSGPLTVRADGDLLTLDFPSMPAKPTTPPPALLKSLNVRPSEVLLATDYMAVFERESDVIKLKPDFPLLESVSEARALICTARGRDCDFVSRFFAPRQGIPEDPVTGSAHCTLTPYWSKQLGKPKLHALQLSPRGGELFCEDLGDRVNIAGRAVLYLEGEIRL